MVASRIMPGALALRGGWPHGTNEWNDEMDANLLWLSTMVQGRIIDQVSNEPINPQQGDVYLLAAAHFSHPNAVAAYDAGAWNYLVPRAGCRLFNATLGVFTQFDGTVWGLDPAGMTAETVRDTIAAALTNGSNVTVTANDAADTITIAAAGGVYDPEAVRDTIAAMLAQGSNVTLTYNDAADTLTIGAAGGGGGGSNVLPSYTKTNIPSAVTAGAGAQAFMTDDPLGAVPVFSDGAFWRRVTDRAKAGEASVPMSANWRLVVTSAQSPGSTVYGREVHIYNDLGAQITDSVCSEPNAVDNNDGTWLAFNGGQGTITYTRTGVPFNISSFTWKIHNATGDGPAHINVQYDSGGGIWVTAWQADIVWTSGSQEQTMLKPA